MIIGSTVGDIKASTAAVFLVIRELTIAKFPTTNLLKNKEKILKDFRDVTEASGV